MFAWIDRTIDGVTMYRMTRHYLMITLLAAAGLSAIGMLHYNPLAILLSAVYLVVVCLAANAVFAYVFEAPQTTESSYITGLILALIITPLASTHQIVLLAAAGGLAVATKYIVAINKRHIFNPAALAVFLLSIGAGETASWWVGTAALLPVVIIGGLLVARKIRRMKMVLTFLATAAVATVLAGWLSHGSIVATVQAFALHSSVFFLGFVMLTEPLTAPPTTAKRTWYAVLVGALFPPQLHILGLYSTPELALLIGNVYAYLVSGKARLVPRLQQRLPLAPDIFDFIYTPERPYAYRAGQYVEVTLDHAHPDDRGRRRYLTLASSPTEDTVRLGIKFYPKGSSFKRALLAANAPHAVAISPPAGDFTLPRDGSQKLAFIAGGIGITPYRSMLKYLLDTGERRDVALLYAEKSPAEFVYTDVLQQAKTQLGMHLVYTVQQPAPDWRGHTGYITADMVRAEVPDYRERLFYLSGSLPMVKAVKAVLRELGVPRKQIKTDYFPGYA